MTLDAAIIAYLQAHSVTKREDLKLYFFVWWKISNEEMEITLTRMRKCGKLHGDKKFALLWVRKSIITTPPVEINL